MKKIIIPAISLAALLLTGACSIDERTSGNNGNEAMLTLNMGLDGAVQTRAIGDGSGADHLIYAVFDETGTRIEDIKQVSKDVKFPTTETITLAKGQTYMIAFWAQNKACTAYTVSDGIVTINYEGAMGNDETRDAFFKTVKVTVTGDAELDVELTRPFAQLNVGIYESDWTAGKDAGIVISTSRAVVRQAASTLNLLYGTVDDPVDVTFDFANIPTDALSVDLDGEGPEDYKYLSMNYILPYYATTGDASTTLEDLEFTFSPETGNDITLTQGLDAVPVQRNWRTNIIGRILSGDLSLNISIDPGFNGNNNHEIWDGNTTNKPESTETEWIVSSAAEWAYLKQHGTQGKNIKLDADINFYGNEVKGIGFSGTFDGQGYKMFNMTLLPGGSDYSNGLFQGDASSGDITVQDLTIENVTAASSNPEHGYVGAIFGDVQNGNLNLENVHVKNVDLRGVQSVGGLVGFVASGKTVNINNCSVDGSKLSNYAVENESGYVAGLVGRPVGTVNVTNSTVTNTTIDAYYAARRGEASIQPVVGYNTELTAGTDVVVKKTSLENAVFVDTPEELCNINVSDVVVALNVDIDFNGAAMTKNIELWGNGIFEGNGHKISNVVCASQGNYTVSLFRGDANGGNKLIKNLVIDGIEATSAPFAAAAIWPDLQNNANIEIDNVHIYNAKIESDNSTGGFIGFVASGSTDVVIKNSSINASAVNGTNSLHKSLRTGALVGRAYGCGISLENVVVDGVTVNGSDATTSNLVKGENSYTGTVTVR